MKDKETHRRTRTEQILGLVALSLLLLGCFTVMKPFLSAGLWAVVLGFSLWPVQRRLTAWLGNRRTLAALLSTLTITLVLVVPLVVIGFSLADDVRALGTATGRWLATGPPAAPTWLTKIPLVGDSAKAIWKEFAEEGADLIHQLKQADEGLPAPQTNDVTQVLTEAPPSAPSLHSLSDSKLVQTLRNLLNFARSWLLRAGLAIGRGALELALSVFLTFFILRDGAAVAQRLTTGVARIAGPRGKYLLDVAGNTVRGVVYGILGTAMVQGGMAGVGFAIAGVPGAALLGLLTFFLSPVPVGPPLVWIPAVIWLFHEGATGWGIFMLVWGVGVSSIDNIVKPWLISQGSRMPFIIIFFGVIGGALAFGLIGVFLGPTLLAVAYRIVEEWSTVSAKPPPQTPAPHDDTPPAEEASPPAGAQDQAGLGSLSP
ncbi:MAG: AI-2E family transporter [Verrucomicrobia bacterium]|nr:AI-2E family transporter [Verrucomicrobiota bacterium]